jgi:hypothetical protein
MSSIPKRGRRPFHVDPVADEWGRHGEDFAAEPLLAPFAKLMFRHYNRMDEG